MATKIKLQVNHGNHAKQVSGQKLGPTDDKNSKIKSEQVTAPVKPVLNKQKQKSNDKAPAIDNKVDSKKLEKQKQKQKKQQNTGTKKNNDVKQQFKKDQKTNIKESKSDKELQTLNRIKSTEQKTKMTIEQLINEYKSAADDIFVNHGHNPQKEKAIQRKLLKLAKQKQQRHKKINSIQQKVLNMQLKNEQQSKQNQKKREQHSKLKRRKKAQKKLLQLKSLSSERLQRQQKYRDYYENEYKSKKFRYQQYEIQHAQREQQYENQIKEKLQKIKQKFQPMNNDQMSAFLDEYESHRWEQIEENAKKRQFQNELLDQENKDLMAKLWRGQCHRRVKEERIQQKMQKNEGKTKLEKTRQYGTIVKDSFKPKINLQRRNNSLNLSQAFTNTSEFIDGVEYKKVARQKYINGVNQGLVLQNLRKSLDYHEQARKGNEYLEHLKSMPKVTKDPNQSQNKAKLDENPQSVRKKSPSTTFKPKIQKNPYYNRDERMVSRSATIEHKRIKDPQMLSYMMADFRARSRDMELEQKAIKYGRYNGILELQDKHSNLNRKLVQDISHKLNILGKM